MSFLELPVRPPEIRVCRDRQPDLLQRVVRGVHLRLRRSSTRGTHGTNVERVNLQKPCVILDFVHERNKMRHGPQKLETVAMPDKLLRLPAVLLLVRPRPDVLRFLDDDVRVPPVAVDRVDEGIVFDVGVFGQDRRVLIDPGRESVPLIAQVGNALDLLRGLAFCRDESFHLLVQVPKYFLQYHDQKNELYSVQT